MKNVLTVLLLTYNHAPWIERCIKSVLEQKTDFPFQICPTGARFRFIPERISAAWGMEVRS